MIHLQQEIESQAKEYASTGLDVNEILQKLETTFNIVPDYKGNPSDGISTQKVCEIVVKAIQAVALAPPPAVATPTAAPIMTGFKERAAVLIRLGIPVVLVSEGTKKAFQSDWPSLATTSQEQIDQWASQYPNANTGAVAQAKLGGVWFLEIDSNNVIERIEQETGNKMPVTFAVRSRAGRGHFYFKQTAASIAMGNLMQGYVKNGDWSGRVDNQYVVGPLSYRADTGTIYEITNDVPLVEAPDWLVAWCVSQKKTTGARKEVPRDEQGLIQNGDGRVHTFMLTNAGRLRQMGLEEEAIKAALYDLVEKNCAGPIDWKKVDAMAKSVCIYAPGTDQSIILNQRPNAAPIQVDDLSWLDTTGMGSRPEFPRWVMEGTSLYENLAKPVSDVNSKYPELIWLPAVQVLLNRLSGNVRIEMIHLNLNMFLGSISEPGRFFKSSSCRLGHEFFKQIGLVDQYDKKLEKGNRVEDRTIVMQTGSSEGFGLTMQKIGTRKAILFNDELGKLTAKIGIENSSFPHDLLSWYESDYFGNTVSNANRNFAFEAGNYCFSWQFCSTTRSFNNQWSKIAGIVSGLLDRMFFLLSPPEPKTLTKEVYVPLLLGAERTGKLINQALTKGIYSVDSGDALEKAAAEFGDPRSMNLVYKLALALAVDLGLETIDDDAVERALALVKYRQDVIRYLAPIEARTEEGRVQQEIVRELRQNGGKMARRDLTRNLHSELYGSRFWNGAYCGLINDLQIREFTETVRGKLKKMVGLVKESVRFGDE